MKYIIEMNWMWIDINLIIGNKADWILLVLNHLKNYTILIITKSFLTQMKNWENIHKNKTLIKGINIKTNRN